MTGEANSAKIAEIRGLAQLRRATEAALGYEPVQVTRAEASAILDRIDALSEVAALLDETFEPSMTEDGEVYCVTEDVFAQFRDKMASLARPKGATQ